MNPSAKDFLRAFEEVSAENIIVFPNNGNLILTAEQASMLYEGAKVTVVKSKSVVECYSALGLLDLENGSLEDNLSCIEDSLNNLICAEISTAVRDSHNNGVEVHSGDYIGIQGGEVKFAKPTLTDATIALFASIIEMGEKSAITVFYGEETTETDKTELRDYIASNFKTVDFIEIQGNQKVYPYIFAIE